MKEIVVKVIPGSKVNKVVGWHNGVLKVKVSAPPVKGRANFRLLEILSDFFQVKKSDILISQGKTTSTKKIVIKD